MGYRGKLDWTYEQWCEWFYAQTTEYESGVKGLEPCMLWMGRMNHEASKVRYAAASISRIKSRSYSHTTSFPSHPCRSIIDATSTIV